MGDELTKEEQKSIDDLKKVCAKRGPKNNRTIRDCALLKSQLNADNRAKNAEMTLVALQTQIALQGERLKAVAYVTARMNAIQNEGMLLLGALQRASADYDQILAARARQPVVFDIIAGLALAALPELKVLGRAVGFFIPSKSPIKRQQIAELVEAAFGDLKVSTSKGSAFINGLDNASKDLIEAIKNPLAANADIDAESSKRFAAHAAKNQILTNVTKSIERTLAAATLLEPWFHRFIFWYDGSNISSILKFAFNAVGFDRDIAYDSKEFHLFSDLILYDMLREYVKNYFVVTVNVEDTRFSGEGPIKDLPQYIPESQIQGLDNAQRKLIYNRFGKVQWSDTSRPPVNDYKDLLQLWGGKVIWNNPWVAP